MDADTTARSAAYTCSASLFTRCKFMHGLRQLVRADKNGHADGTARGCTVMLAERRESAVHLARHGRLSGWDRGGLLGGVWNGATHVELGAGCTPSSSRVDDDVACLGFLRRWHDGWDRWERNGKGFVCFFADWFERKVGEQAGVGFAFCGDMALALCFFFESLRIAAVHVCAVCSRGEASVARPDIYIHGTVHAQRSVFLRQWSEFYSLWFGQAPDRGVVARTASKMNKLSDIIRLISATLRWGLGVSVEYVLRISALACFSLVLFRRLIDFLHSRTSAQVELQKQ